MKVRQTFSHSHLGLNSFLDPPISIKSLDVVGGVPGSLSLRLGITIQNPSIIYGKLGDFSLNLFSQNEVLPFPFLFL